MTGDKSQRVMIIGLDGATLDLICPWAQAGLLPTFRQLMEDGAWGPLRTVTPPITPTAWSSFMTGMNPGKHGLFDFTLRKKDRYETYVIDAGHRDGSSLWQLLSRAGHRVIVFNVPITYPPERVNGLMISGLLTPSGATDASWPPGLQEELKQAIPGFSFSPPGMHSRGQELQFVRSVRTLNQTTLEATRYLMKKQPWDFIVTVFMGTDIMSHFMWEHASLEKAFDPESTEDVLANAIRDCYQDVDSAVGELMQAAGEDTHVFVMSDHGFGEMASYMSVNAWLVNQGYLKFKRNPWSRLRYAMYRLGITPLSIYRLLLALQMGGLMRRTARRSSGLMARIVKAAFLSLSDVDWSRTRAYAFGYGGPVFVNLKGREPQGIVEPGPEHEALMAQLTAELRLLREPDTGLPFVGEIYRGSELYSGPHVAEAPDLVFMPRDPKYAGLGLADFPSNKWLTPSPDRSGHHRLDGILFVSGPGIRPAFRITGASIMDLAPTVLGLMGVPIPEAMDGQVLKEMMTEELRAELDLTYTREASARSGLLPGQELTEEEEELLRSRLRDLGYVA